MKDIKIVNAKPKDAKELAFLQKEVWMKTYPNKKVGITKDDIKFRFSDMDKKVSNWQKNITNKKQDELILVAKSKGLVVGFCVATKKKRENTVTALYIDSKFQRQGIGSLFLSKVFSWFTREKQITVFVAEYNKKAINFYKKYGFVDTGKRIKEDFFKMKSGNYIIEALLVFEKK